MDFDEALNTINTLLKVSENKTSRVSKKDLNSLLTYKGMILV